MDLYCKKCGEPYDFDYVQHEMEPDERKRFHVGEGCPSCYGKPVARRPFRAMIAEALGDVLGDDLDGLAAEMEDAEYMLGGDFWD